MICPSFWCEVSSGKLMVSCFLYVPYTTTPWRFLPLFGNLIVDRRCVTCFFVHISHIVSLVCLSKLRFSRPMSSWSFLMSGLILSKTNYGLKRLSSFTNHLEAQRRRRLPHCGVQASSGFVISDIHSSSSPSYSMVVQA